MISNLKSSISKTSSLQKTLRIILLVLIVIGLGLLVTQKLWVPKLVTFILADELAVLSGNTASSTNASNTNQATSTQPEPSTDDSDKSNEVPVVDLPPQEENTDLALGETGKFGTLTILPLKVEEDSRCPKEVTCIWAGTVEVRTILSTPVSHGEHTLTLGEPQPFGEYTVTLREVTPVKTEAAVPDSSYRFSFTVDKQTDSGIPDTKGDCYIGGCSSQLCTDKNDMVSTCEYREEYMCYQTAECKRQASGECGWTETAELLSCLGTKREDVR